MSGVAEANASAIARIVRDVQVVSDGSFVIERAERKVSAEEGRPAHETLAAAIATQLYSRYYTNPTLVMKATQLVEDPNLQQKFLAELVKANHSRWSWTRWRAVREEDGNVALESGAGRLIVPATQVDGPDEEGYGRIRTDKGSSTVQRAWYWAYGENNGQAEKGKVVRLYWAVSGEGAIPLLKTLTRALNEQGIPFQYKTLQDPQQYTRADSAVLYLPAHVWPRASRTIARTHAALEHYLVDKTPLFAKRLARGLAIADDPGKEAQSFGSHRTALIAAALVRAHGEAVPTERVYDRVVGHLTEQGYPLDRLHLEPWTARDHEYQAVPAGGV